MTRYIASSIAFLCTSWSLLYLIYGNTPHGKSWFGKISSKATGDVKAVPILTLAAPLLISGSTCTLFLRRSSARHKNGYPLSQILPLRWTLSLKKHGSDISFNVLSFWIVFVPCTCYFVCGIYRHFHGQHLSFDDMARHVGNSFGQLSLVSFSFFLVPVARHSPFLKLMDWSETNAVRIHIWSGRLGIIGATGHGLLHIGRWLMKKESIISMVTPPVECWRPHAGERFEPICADETTECSCYAHFRNMTGFLATASLCIVGISSINFVRRKYYCLFYSLHLIFGSFAMLMAVLHWRRTILYLCPSIIYYFASSIPVFAQVWMSGRGNGVKILSVVELPSGTTNTVHSMRSCVSVDLEASEECMEQIRPGQYVKLYVPDISLISHPFSVNTCEGRGIRIIFRVTGPFTRALADRLLHPPASTLDVGTRTVPSLLVDGFYGPPDRIHQVLSHDVALIVAAGIGITPYLSLITDLAAEYCSDLVHHPKTEIILHWLCRDDSLIDYVSRKYFDPLVQDEGPGCEEGHACCIRVEIHKTTGPAKTPKFSAVEYSGIERTGERGVDESGTTIDYQGGPMKASRFCAGANEEVISNIPHFITFSLIAGLSLWSVTLVYRNFTSKTTVSSRAFGLLAPLVITVVLSLVVNAFWDNHRVNAMISSCEHLQQNLQLWYNRLIPRRSHGSLSVSEGVNKRVQRELSLPGLAVSRCGLGVRGEIEQDQGQALPLHFESGQRAQPFTISQTCGRPSPHTVLRSLEDARNPGVFLCGPSEMMREIREAAVARCSMHDCLDGFNNPVFYTETFEL